MCVGNCGSSTADACIQARLGCVNMEAERPALRVTKLFNELTDCSVPMCWWSRVAMCIGMAASKLPIAGLVDAVRLWFAWQRLQIAVELLRQGDAWRVGIAWNPVFSRIKWLSAHNVPSSEEEVEREKRQGEKRRPDKQQGTGRVVKIQRWQAQARSSRSRGSGIIRQGCRIMSKARNAKDKDIIEVQEITESTASFLYGPIGSSLSL